MMRYIGLLVLIVTFLPLHAGVNSRLRQAGKLYDNEKYGQALETYQQALQEDATNSKAAFGAGAAAYQLKDYQQAAQAFEAVSQDTTSPLGHDALFNLGNTYYRAGDKQQAVAAYKRAIVQNSDDKEAVHNLQLVLQEQQNQQNKNNQNNQNQNQQSQNNDAKEQQDNKGQAPQQKEQPPQQPQQPQDQQSQLDKQAAQRIMQMARDNEYKRPTQPGQNSGDDNVEKDW